MNDTPQDSDDNATIMRLVEMPEFTARLYERIDDDSYAELQHFLIEHPNAGDVIPGGGIRKLRWCVEGRGKSFGVRVIYFG